MAVTILDRICGEEDVRKCLHIAGAGEDVHNRSAMFLFANCTVLDVIVQACSNIACQVSGTARVKPEPRDRNAHARGHAYTQQKIVGCTPAPGEESQFSTPSERPDSPHGSHSSKLKPDDDAADVIVAASAVRLLRQFPRGLLRILHTAAFPVNPATGHTGSPFQSPNKRQQGFQCCR